MVVKFKTDLRAASDTIQDLKSRNESLEIESTQRFNACVTAQHEIGRLTDLETSFKKSNQGLINLSIKLLTKIDRSQPRRLLGTRIVPPQRTSHSACCQHQHYSPGHRVHPDLPPRLPIYQTSCRSQSGAVTNVRHPLNSHRLHEDTVTITHHPTVPPPYLRERSPSHQGLGSPSTDSLPSSPGTSADRLISIHHRRGFCYIDRSWSDISFYAINSIVTSSSTAPIQ
ncbi:hypothetical protein MJO29_016445 [Puccinia striiformis f. sp. tritici]|nr:hypothetical protein MJO29_016445 [Puccinia striiformis f. sp. tritici]